VFTHPFSSVYPFSVAMRRPWPRWMLAAHSARPLILESENHFSDLLARALQLRAMQHGEGSAPFPGVRMFTLKRDAGAVVVAENRSRQLFTVELDCRNSFNMVSARGVLATEDTVMPGTRQIIQVLSQAENSGYSFSMSMKFKLCTTLPGFFQQAIGMPGEPRHVPPLDDCSVAIFQPLQC